MTNVLYVFAGLLLLSAVLIIVYFSLVRYQIKLIETGTHSQLVKMLNTTVTLVSKSAEYTLETATRKLHTIDKQLLCAAIYDDLPDELDIKVMGLYYSVSWKTYIGKQQFVEFAGKQYDKLVRDFDVLKDSIEALME